MRRPNLLLGILSLMSSACVVANTIPQLTATTVHPTAATIECGYMWATRPLPDLSQQWQVALDDAGIETTEAYAEAYGEDITCGDRVDFDHRETDFYVTMSVVDLADFETMGNLAESVLAVLKSFSDPYRYFGQMRITFVSNRESRHLWFVIDQVDGGLHGAELFWHLDQLEP